MPNDQSKRLDSRHLSTGTKFPVKKDPKIEALMKKQRRDSLRFSRTQGMFFNFSRDQLVDLVGIFLSNYYKFITILLDKCIRKNTMIQSYVANISTQANTLFNINH